ncbi:phosphatase [Clostridium sp. 19966]|uniref:phosphatase n=1 Tax=Clostridium sp. 19966 TaxID=2768166 RepID=UPI0028DEA8D8|nr:phosphatase [Clostridium sp. 19966]MDT8715726.1 phosphatase [Clostridium sp. 19966]
MKYVVDIHTHTLVSGHAYSTLMENAKYASEIGLKVLGTTDHGPAMPGSPHIWYFGNLKVLPRELFGVKMLYGCEANVIDYEGNLDIPEEIQERLNIMIVSLHEPILEGGKDPEINTKALLKVMDNSNVHIIGHCGNPRFPIYKEEIVKKAKEKNILIEINNSSFKSSRVGSEDNCTEIAALCKNYGAKIILNTDSHFCNAIGNFSEAEKIIKKVDMPENLIINTNEYDIFEYLKRKGKKF